MNQRDDLDQMLSAWLDDPYTPAAPRYLGEVLEVTRRTRQRPAWASLERWLPMAIITARSASAVPLRMAWLLLITLLVVAFAATVAFVGSQLLRATVAIPQGGAAVLVFDKYPGPKDGQVGDIYTVNADGTALRQLTSGPDADMAPSWSPDGTRIAYRPWQDGAGSVVVMDAGGGHRTTLATMSQSSKDCTRWELAAWSPDGKALVYPASAACDGNYDLFIVPTDGSAPATRLLAPGIISDSAAWSPDGTQIAFVGHGESGDTGLYVVDVGAGDAIAGGLQARRITEAGTSLDWLAPRWSPDGAQLAAAAGTNADCIAYNSGTLDAFVVKADGSGQRPLAAETAKEYNPTWSPNGTQLAFQRIVDASEWLLGRPCTMATWVIDADGTNERRVEGLGSDNTQPPFWSPDGTRLVGNTVTRVDGLDHFDLYIVTVDGSSPLVTIDLVGIASWQPVAAPLPPAPSFAAVSPTP